MQLSCAYCHKESATLTGDDGRGYCSGVCLVMGGGRHGVLDYAYAAAGIDWQRCPRCGTSHGDAACPGDDATLFFAGSVDPAVIRRVTRSLTWASAP